MVVTVKTSATVRTAPVTRVEEFVQPTELCDTQRRSLAYDAFAALQVYGF